ncbi:MAG: hypothetical protein ACKOZY_04545 [Flavobacteriales bacterium]
MAVQPIQFLPAVHQRDYFFPVSEQNVFVGDSVQHAQRWREHKALFNADLNEPIALVSKRFHVFTHEQAHQLGERIFKQLFAHQPVINKQSLSSDTTDYLVEFVHDGVYIEFSASGYRFHGGDDRMHMEMGDRLMHRQSESLLGHRNERVPSTNVIATNFIDRYHPFIRVNNHLAGGKSFTIELGYYRARCCNGLLYGSRNAMTFRRSYLSTAFPSVEADALFYFSHRRIQFMGLASQLYKLLLIPCPADQLHLIALDIYRGYFQRWNRRQCQDYRDVLIRLADKYRQEIGCNVNAALNVATEFAQYLCHSRYMAMKLQRDCSEWLMKKNRTGYHFSRYLQHMADIEEELVAGVDQQRT